MPRESAGSSVGVNHSPGMGSRVQGGPGFGGGGLRGKRRTGEWRSEATGIATRRRWRDYGSGLVSPPARRVRWACAPPCSSARGRRSLPARERRSGSGFAGFLPGASRWPGKRFRRMQWGLPLGLALPPAPGVGAEGFGCRFAQARRAEMGVPQRDHRSSRGRRRIARFGAAARGAAISSAPPTRGRAGHGS